jgi:hypothetical protein
MKNQPQSLIKLFKTLVTNTEYEGVNQWKKDCLGFVNEVSILQNALISRQDKSIEDDGHFHLIPNLSVRSYRDFMKKWLKDKNNGIASVGQSTLSDNNFEIIIKNPDFKQIAREVIEMPNQANYDKMLKWWKEHEIIRNHPLLINRALAACNPQQLSTTVDDKKFKEVVKVLVNKWGFVLPQKQPYNWFEINTTLSEWLDTTLQSELSNYSTDKREQLIGRNIFVWMLYDHLTEVKEVQHDTLIEKPRPKGRVNVPKSPPTFNPVTIDYEKEYQRKKKLGNAGEDLVIKYEKERLRKAGLDDLAEQVEKQLDGVGYDILSFDTDARKKYIEVKTTTNTDDESSFYLTEHEVDFMRLNSTQYSIYRIYGYKSEFNFGNFFEIKANVEPQLELTPIAYKVTLKNES